MHEIDAKLRILLINPRLRAWSPNVYIPLGITYIGTVLKREGYNVEIVDLNAEKMDNRKLLRKVENADIVGITGMITEYAEVLRLIKMAKEAKENTKVILGGPLATTLPKELLQASRADFVVIGEGERTIVNLVSAIRQANNLADIKGIAYKDGDRIIVTDRVEPIANLDTIPFPARNLLHMKRYLKNYFKSFGLKIEGFGEIISTNLITSRGCPYNCTFCFKGMWGHKWRGRSPANVVTEMELLYSTYGVNGFLFTDDVFVLDRKRVFEFCQLLKNRGMHIAWYCNGRVNLMTKELLKAMYDTGCRGICYGIESGNQQVLDSMKKNITLDQAREVVRWTKEAGINVIGYFMIGLPGETKATIKETIAFAKELELDFYSFSLTTPFPGTELYDSALKAGLIRGEKTSLKDWSLHVNANLTQDCSAADLAAFENEAFKEFYLKRRFGKYYFFTPVFLKEVVSVLLSLRNKEQAKELAKKAAALLAPTIVRHK